MIPVQISASRSIRPAPRLRNRELLVASIKAPITAMSDTMVAVVLMFRSPCRRMPPRHEQALHESMSHSPCFCRDASAPPYRRGKPQPAQATSPDGRGLDAVRGAGSRQLIHRSGETSRPFLL